MTTQRAGWNLYGKNVDQDLIEAVMDGMADASRTVDGGTFFKILKI